MTDPGGIRISHADRDAVIEVLREAASEGRITVEELEQRVEAALAAKVVGDLDPLVADLPVPAPSQQLAAPGTAGAAALAQVPGTPVTPGMSADDPLRLSGGVSTTKREGRWEVPPYLALNSGMGTVHLDCLDAVPLAPVISVEVARGAGDMVIIAPHGWGANLDRLSTSWGSAKSELPTQPEQGHPLLVFTGGVGMGSLKIRYPSRRMLRRRAKRG